MAHPKIHPDRKAAVRSAMSAHRGRMKALSPVERLAKALDIQTPYTPEELEDLGILKAMVAEVERLAGNLNGSLKERLGADNPFAAELDKDTRIQIRTY